MAILDGREIKQHDPSRVMWLVTFINGEEYVVFNEDEIVEQFGDGDDYVAVKGIWRPEE